MRLRLICVNVMQSDLEALERKQAQYNSMDKRSNDLSKEVKILQEGLADYNTVLDKVSTSSWVSWSQPVQPICGGSRDVFLIPRIMTRAGPFPTVTAAGTTKP
jgi:hypothetical protein